MTKDTDAITASTRVTADCKRAIKSMHARIYRVRLLGSDWNFRLEGDPIADLRVYFCHAWHR
jgi:hypothetical protein